VIRGQKQGSALNYLKIMSAITRWNPFKETSEWNPFRELDDMHNRLSRFFGATAPEMAMGARR